MTKELSNETFEKEIIESGKPALVDFWAPWCGPCRMMGPIIDKISEGFGDKIVVAKVNIDDCPDVAAKYNVTSIPTLIFFKNSEPVETGIGVMQQADVEKIIKEKLL